MRRSTSMESDLAPRLPRGGARRKESDAAGVAAPPGAKHRLAAWCAPGRACVAACLVAVALVAAAWSRRSADLSVRASHMSFRQRAGDAYWLARAKASEVARLGLAPARGGRGRFNASAARLTCAAQDPPLVMHLKVPKAASTTVFDLVHELSAANAYAVNSRPMYVDEARPRASAREYAAYFAARPDRTVRTAHGAYVDLRAAGVSRPCYVAVVREPLRRLESHYDYIHWGPRSRWATFWKGQDRAAPSFRACAAKHAAARSRGGRALAGAAADRGDCLYWANAQLAYFCGVGGACALRALRTRAGGAAALARALANVDRDFAVVGVVEDLAGSLAVLERVLPTYFAGIRAAYDAQATHSRANGATPPDDLDDAAAATVEPFLRHVLKWEYALYDRLRRKFADQKRACGLAEPPRARAH